jgi:chromate transporter
LNRSRLGELARLFLRLGVTAFGGPAAHVALMHEEVVRRRGWMDEQRFLDLVGATSLIPGPNSTELAMHVGRLRGRGRGLVVAGAAFILPAALIVLVLAWAYVEYGSTPAADALLYGIEPVIIAIVVHALVSLSRTALRGPLLVALGAGALLLYLRGVNEIAQLFGAAALAALARRAAAAARGGPAAPWGLVAAPFVPLAAAPAGVDLDRLFLVFVKIGAVLYGSGYVLLAFLRSDFVARLGWLTDAQVLDAVAIGQATPGPVFTTATFVGYVVAGLEGAVLATVGIFLPSFLLVAALNPLIPRLRQSPWTAALLDGVNAAAVGLMAGVTALLARDALVDAITVTLAVAAAVVMLATRINPAWLVAAGGAVGLSVSLLR